MRTMHGVQRLVLLARGLAGEPRGAWFEPVHGDGLVRAARQAGAYLVEVEAARLRELDPALPAGQLLAPGRPSPLPLIQRSTFDRLISLPPVVAIPRQLDDEADQERTEDRPRRPPALRTTKRTIKAGTVVLASTSLEDGWWEAEVVAVNLKILLLRWCNFPEYPPFEKDAASVSLAPTGGVR